MPDFQRATVALSMSATDAELIRYAALLSRCGVVGDFSFVHVVTPANRHGAGDLDLLRQKLKDQVQQEFGTIANRADAVSEIRESVRVDGLIEASIDQKSDLILLGHRRIRSGRRSLARRLAMISPCSVWIVPEGSAAQIAQVLAPVDFSVHSAGSLTMATSIAQRMSLERCLGLHVYFDPSTIRYDEHVAATRQQAQQAFAEFLAPLDVHAQVVEPLIEESTNVGRTILRVAASRGVDLIVMSTRGRSHAAAILLGSATAQTLAESPVPVLAVKHHGAHLSLYQVLKDPRLWQSPSPKAN